MVFLILLYVLYERMQADPSQSVVHFDGPKGWFGSYEATVYTVDFNGNIMTRGGAMIEAATRWGSLDVVDNRDGTYSFSCTSFAKTVYVAINGEKMNGSPFHFKKKS